MNKSYAKIGAAVCVVLGVTWLGTTWYGGQHIIKQYPEALAKINSSQLGAMKFVITKQQSGFLTSHVNWDLIITPNPCAPSATFKISGYDDIQNGLIPSLGFGQIHSHIIWPEQAQPFLSKMFGQKEPIKITTNISLLGALTSKISSPDAIYKDEKGDFEWKGFRGEISRSQDTKRSDIDFDFAGLNIKSSQKQFFVQLDKMSYESEIKEGDSGVGIGEGELSLNGLNVEKDGKKFGFKELKIKSDTSEKEGFLAVNFKAKIEKFLQNDKNIGQFDMAFNAEHIDAKTLNNVNNLAKKLRTECKPDYSVLMQAAQPIFTKGVRATLNNADIELFGGKAHAEVKANLPPLTTAEVQDPKSGLLKLEIDGKANFSDTLVAAIAKIALEASSQGQPIDPQQQAQMITKMLEKPLSEGLLVKTADGYASNFQIRQGKTSVNGKALN